MNVCVITSKNIKSTVNVVAHEYKQIRLHVKLSAFLLENDGGQKLRSVSRFRAAAGNGRRQIFRSALTALSRQSVAGDMVERRFTAGQARP